MKTQPLYLLISCCLIIACSDDGGDGNGPVCGDGVVAGDEGCDDGNLDDADGCSATCAVESGWECDLATQPSVCAEDNRLTAHLHFRLHPLVAPLTAGAASLDGAALSYSLEDYAAPGTPLHDGVLDTTSCDSAHQHCFADLQGVDPDDVVIGFNVVLDDVDDAARDDFLKTVSHYALAPEVLGAADVLEGLESLVWTWAAAAALSKSVGAAAGETWSDEEIVCRGFHAAFAVNLTQNRPAAGVTLDVGDGFSVYYFDANATTLEGLFTGTATDTSGGFVIVPDLPDTDDNGRCDPGEITGGFVRGMTGQNGDGSVVCDLNVANAPGVAWNIPVACRTAP